MGKGKKKNRADFLNAVAEAPAPPENEDEPKLSRKQKREAKLAKKQQSSGQNENADQSGAEDEEMDELEAPRKSAFATLDDSDEEDEAPVKSMSKKDKRKAAKKAAGKKKAESEEEDEDAQEEDENEDEEEEEEEEGTGGARSGFAMLGLSDEDDEDDEDDGKKKKKKKEKKEKKEKKKKSKKAKDGDDEGEVFYGNPEDEGVYENEEDGGEETQEKKGRGKKGKLSNKERRKLKESQEAEQRDLAIKAMANKETDFAVSATVQQKDEAWENATDINIPSFTISAYGKTLFRNAELKIAAGRKYGIVGPNGHGKSTLLKQLANGELAIPPKIDCLYVEQEVKADETPAVEMVLLADKERTRLMDREKEIIKILEEDVNDELSLEEHERLQSELKEVTDDLRARGNDSAEARALSLLAGLGFTKDMQRAPTRSFSGGWRMRVSIARALFLEPTLMLLDEPTNHLDLNAVLWLDTYLQKWKKTLMIVSHDEDFLDSVCTDIIHLDQQRLFYYKGNFSQFQDQLGIHKDKMKKEFEKQEKQLKALKSKGNTNKKAAEQLAKKSKREAGGARKNKKGADAVEDDAAGSLTDRHLLSRPKDYEVKFTFPQPSELAPPIIQIDDVSFWYNPNNKLFKKISFGIDMQSRVTIVGPNGVGKSTLLKLVTGELEPSKGEVKINRFLRIARYHQHFVDVLPVAESPVDFLRRMHPECSYQEARNRLGKFGLEGTAHTIKMLNCSGGQKARVVFASMSFQNPHILIMDEPTNNLDLESIQALCEAINEFDGGVVLVTHDARLIQETECVLWVVENQTVYEQIGGFEAYKNEILDRLSKQEEEEKKILEEKQMRANEERQKKLDEIAARRKAKMAKAAA